MGHAERQGTIAAQVEELLAVPGPLTIVTAGDPVLRRGAEPFGGQLDPGPPARFVGALRLTLHEAPGAGPAAPQVGVPLRIAVLEDPAPVPEEVPGRGSARRSRSGC